MRNSFLVKLIVYTYQEQPTSYTHYLFMDIIFFSARYQKRKYVLLTNVLQLRISHLRISDVTKVVQ